MEYRDTILLSDGWESTLVETGMEDSDHIPCEKNWEAVRIPHNWEKYHGYHSVSHGNLHGTAWYRKALKPDPSWNGRRIWILFEGVGTYADVWVNDIHKGSHTGGRTCFWLDITDALKENEENLLVVRAKHPAMGKDQPWICGGCYGTPNSEGSQPLGIFRPVHLQLTDDIRISPFGVAVHTCFDGSEWNIETDTEITSVFSRKETLIVDQELVDSQGQILCTCSNPWKAQSPGLSILHQSMPSTLSEVLLWDPDHPNLYRIRTTIRSGQKILDTVENSFGFTTIEWENFERDKTTQIDPQKLSEEPTESNCNFVNYLRGDENAEVVILPGQVRVYLNHFTVDQVQIEVETTLKNQSIKPHIVQLETFVQTFNQTKVIANLSTRVTLSPGESKILLQKCDPLLFPEIWTPQNPYLYNCISTVRGIDEDLREYCQTSTPFAIREHPGLANKGDAYIPEENSLEKIKRRFLINGKHYFLNGSCEYEHELGNDHAFTDEMIHTRMSMFSAAGFNAFREAHCPHNLRYLEYCEQNGILYWAQMGAHIYFDTEEFRNNFLKLTEEWIRERRNSPAVILWGIQNESMLPSWFTEQVRETIHSLDRKSPEQRKAVTCNGGTGSDWNIPQNWSGTYGGTVENYGTEAVRMKLIGEYGQYRVCGKHQEGDMHSFQNSGGDVSEELFAFCLETKVREAEKIREYFYGHFQWIFCTHVNPGRELLYCLDGVDANGVGVVNNKGLFTSWGEPTDTYFMYRSNYTKCSDTPVLYIVSHSWSDRIQAPGKLDITVYSNCDEVELYNDYGILSVGRQKNPGIGSHFLFSDVQIDTGVVTVIGYYQGKKAATDRIFFTALPLPAGSSPAEAIDSLGAKSDDLYRINCGGANYLDTDGYLWSKDRPYQGNGYGYRTWGMRYDDVPDDIGSCAKSFNEINGTADHELFQTFRYGRDQLEYLFPVEAGYRYQLELYFVEPWYGLSGEHADGWRCFDLAVNDEIVLHRIDIWKETGGAGKLLKKIVEVSDRNGVLKISFPRIYSNQALIHAIKIRKAE